MQNQQPVPRSILRTRNGGEPKRAGRATFGRCPISSKLYDKYTAPSTVGTNEQESTTSHLKRSRFLGKDEKEVMPPAKKSRTVRSCIHIMHTICDFFASLSDMIVCN